MKEASVNQVDGFVAVDETALYQGSAFHISKKRFDSHELHQRWSQWPWAAVHDITRSKQHQCGRDQCDTTHARFINDGPMTDGSLAAAAASAAITAAAPWPSPPSVDDGAASSAPAAGSVGRSHTVAPVTVFQ